MALAYVMLYSHLYSSFGYPELAAVIKRRRHASTSRSSLAYSYSSLQLVDRPNHRNLEGPTRLLTSATLR